MILIDHEIFSIYNGYSSGDYKVKAFGAHKVKFTFKKMGIIFFVQTSPEHEPALYLNNKL
jgi:hypothetical protein